MACRNPFLCPDALSGHYRLRGQLKRRAEQNGLGMCRKIRVVAGVYFGSQFGIVVSRATAQGGECQKTGHQKNMGIKTTRTAWLNALQYADCAKISFATRGLRCFSIEEHREPPVWLHNATYLLIIPNGFILQPETLRRFRRGRHEGFAGKKWLSG
jgi:hypothetical protein